jgi:hypothetical protein
MDDLSRLFCRMVACGLMGVGIAALFPDAPSLVRLPLIVVLYFAADYGWKSPNA